MKHVITQGHLVLFLCLTILLIPNTYAQTRYSNVIIFGDSLSDTGNLAGTIINLPFPYYNNRISNGPVAVDHVAKALGKNANASKHLTSIQQRGYNYAIAGGNIVGNDPEDLNSQVNAYLSRTNNKIDSNALYIFMIGGNDLRGIHSISNAATASIRIQQTVNTLSMQLSRLLNAGTKHALVANIPNIGRLPETIQREASTPNISSRATRYSQQYNQQLEKALNTLRQQHNAQIITFDLYQNMESLLRQAPNLGFTQTQRGCFNSNNFTFHPDCQLGTRFDRFVFFDNIHPTSKTHQWLGDQIIQTLRFASHPKTNTQIVLPALILLLEN